MQDYKSPRVNAARLPNFLGRTVRLPCKVLNRHCKSTQEGHEALVEASDGGQVIVQIKENELENFVGTFVEIIGGVVNESTIKFVMSLNLDADKELDMKLVNDVVELTFDPRFAKMFPS